MGSSQTHSASIDFDNPMINNLKINLVIINYSTLNLTISNKKIGYPHDVSFIA
jgi:hypothetical protein